MPRPRKYNSEDKYCSNCNRRLGLSLFYKNKGVPSGLSSWCRDCASKDSKVYSRNNRKRIKDRVRKEVFSYYGGGDIKCVCCGEREIKFMSLDHINGNGGKERKETKRVGVQFYAFLIRTGFPDGLQTLCYNCNLAKGFFGECPHKYK